jgi:PAS domain S-box-containing protein
MSRPDAAKYAEDSAIDASCKAPGEVILGHAMARPSLNRIAFRTAAVYGLIAAAWILLSDRAVIAIASDPETIARISEFKGLAFVAVTAVLLFALVRGQLGRYHAAVATRLEAEERFAKAFDCAPVFLCTTTLDSDVYLDVNEHALRLTGYEARELIGQTAASVGLLSPEDRARVADCLRKHGRVDGLEVSLRRKDGRAVTCLVNAEQLHLGGRSCLLTIALDVTESRRASAEVLRLSQAVEQSPSAIVITDAAGAIEYVNSQFTRMTGYAFDEVRGRTPRILKSGETPPEAYQRLWQTISAGGTWRGVFHNRTKSGDLYWERATISPMRDAGGRITHYFAVKEDLTELKLLEEQFRQAQKMEAVGQLAGGIAHDYNNILTAMMMHLGLLDDEADVPPRLRSTLRELEKLAARSARLTRQLLTFSRQQPVNVAPLDLGALVNNLLGMLRHLLGEPVALDYRADPAPLWVRADAGMMEQVVTNLAVNARDAMAPHGGRLTIELRRITIDSQALPANPDAYAGTFVRLAVTDTGCGMTPATQKRIFEPFFTTKDVGKGTGLGLATVFGITQQHHGWIEVESAPGQGSTFRVFLPALDEAPAATGPSHADIAMQGTETILLVEDEPAVLETAVRGLRSLGYRVITATNGPEALATWEQHAGEIEVLVTDLVMPQGLNGIDLARRLRASKPELRVVIASGYSRSGSTPGLGEVAGAAFLQKPFELPTLTAAIRHQCDRR